MMNFAFQIVLFASLAATVIGMVVWVLCYVFPKKLSPSVTYILWALVMLRLACFWCPSSQFSACNLFVSPTASPAKQSGSAFTDSKGSTLIVQSQTKAFNEPTLKLSNVDSTNSLWSAESFLSIACIIWLVGVFAFLIVLLVQTVALARVVRRSCLPPQELQILFEHCCHSLRVNQKVQFVVTDQISTPGIIGVWHPAVLIPDWCVKSMTKDQIQLIITHELIHLKRRDTAKQLVFSLIHSIHWFNPLVLIAIRRIGQLREIFCDRAVLSTAIDGVNPNRKLYGQTILQITEYCSTTNRHPVLLNGFVGITSQKKQLNSIFERIQMLDTKRNQKGRFKKIVGGCIAVVLVATGFTSAQEPAKTNPEERLPGTLTQQPIYAVPIDVSRQPIPIDELQKNDRKFAEPILADASYPAFKNRAWEKDGEIIGYSVIVIRGEKEKIESFGQEKFSKKTDRQMMSWFEGKLDLEELVSQADETNLLSNRPVMVSKIGLPCELFIGHELPLIRGWKADESGNAIPIHEFQKFGLSVEINSVREKNDQLTTQLAIEESEVDGTEKTTIKTSNGYEVMIDRPNFSHRSRVNAAFETEKDGSMIICYPISDSEKNQATMLIVTPIFLTKAIPQSDERVGPEFKLSEEARRLKYGRKQ